MKGCISIFCFLVFYHVTIGQVPASFYIDENTQYSACNFSQDHIYFGLNGKVVKTDFQGNVIWSKSNLPFPRVFAGSFYYSLIGDGTISNIIKCDTSGNVIWTKDISTTVCPQYNGDYNGLGGMVVNGNRIYLSSIQYNLFTGSDGLSALLTLDTSGNVVNAWCDPIAPFPSDYISTGFHSISGGGWFLFTHGGVGIEASIVKMNIDGTVDTINPTVEIDMGVSVSVRDIMLQADSTYIALCNIDGNGIGGNYIGLSKFKEDGSVQWQELLFNQFDTSAMLISATHDSSGNIYAIGYIGGNTFQSIITMKLNSNGAVVFVKEWSDPALISSFQNCKLYYKNGMICCFLNHHDGVQYHPGILVFDTLFNACSIPDNYISITPTPDPMWNGFWTSYQPINYTTISDTMSPSSASNPFTGDLCLALSSNEIHSVGVLEIFPNPFQNKFSLRFKEGEKTLLAIFNLTGRKIFESEITNDQSIDLSDFPSGVYQLSVTSDSMRVNKKIIKY